MENGKIKSSVWPILIMKIWHNVYSEITTLESLFQAWDQFIKGKKKKTDVLAFTIFLENNLFPLYESLKNKTYKHGGYQSFYVRDPKVRHISKAVVKDRVVHHLVSAILYKIFDSSFYMHSYSCRKEKGTHKAVEAFIKIGRKASKNNSSKCFVLKCDIKKYFATVDHKILKELLKRKVKDEELLWLLDEIINSWHSEYTLDSNNPKGMPIGNLTSQLFANIYLDPLDRFVKHELKVEYYLRYADDFAILGESEEYLESLISKIEGFLKSDLKLSLHPDKIIIRDYYLGTDFLGYVIFPHFILPRTKTKKRLFKKIKLRIERFKQNEISAELLNQTIQSYLGYLSHSNAYELTEKLKKEIFLSLKN